MSSPGVVQHLSAELEGLSHSGIGARYRKDPLAGVDLNGETLDPKLGMCLVSTGPEWNDRGEAALFRGEVGLIVDYVDDPPLSGDVLDDKRGPIAAVMIEDLVPDIP